MTTYLQDARELQRVVAARIAEPQVSFHKNIVALDDTTARDVLGALAVLIEMLESRDGECVFEAEVERLEDAIANLRALVLP